MSTLLEEPVQAPEETEQTSAPPAGRGPSFTWFDRLRRLWKDWRDAVAGPGPDPDPAENAEMQLSAEETEITQAAPAQSPAEEPDEPVSVEESEPPTETQPEEPCEETGESPAEEPDEPASVEEAEPPAETQPEEPCEETEESPAEEPDEPASAAEAEPPAEPQPVEPSEEIEEVSAEEPDESASAAEAEPSTEPQPEELCEETGKAPAEEPDEPIPVEEAEPSAEPQPVKPSEKIEEVSAAEPDESASVEDAEPEIISEAEAEENAPDISAPEEQDNPQTEPPAAEEEAAGDQEAEPTPAGQEGQAAAEQTEAQPESGGQPEGVIDWFRSSRYRLCAVLAAGMLMLITTLTVSELFISVNVYRNGKPEQNLWMMTIQHDINALLGRAGFTMNEGDGYRWSGYGEDRQAELVYCPAFSLTIEIPNQSVSQLRTNSLEEKTLEELLNAAGYAIGPLDYTEPQMDTVPLDDLDVVLHRVVENRYDETREIPYETEYKKTSLFYRNQKRTMTMVTGQNGEALVHIFERYVDGERVDYRESQMEMISEPVNEVIKIYGEKAPVSDLEGPELVDGVPPGWRKVLSGRCTGYSSGRSGRKVKGASGMWLTYGTAAVNPNIIPYGTKMYIVSQDGNFVYGYCIAADTGGALMDGTAVIDLFYDTYEESVINAVWQVDIYVE